MLDGRLIDVAFVEDFFIAGEASVSAIPGSRRRLSGIDEIFGRF